MAFPSEFRDRPFQADMVFFYQPESILIDRLASPEALAAYATTLETGCAAFFSHHSISAVLELVVAVKPGKRSRVWCNLSGQVSSCVDLAVLRSELENIEPPAVKNGPIAVAFITSIGGAELKAPETGPGFRPPMPREWVDATRTTGLGRPLPEGALDVVWPD